MKPKERIEKLNETANEFFENKEYEKALICLNKIYQMNPDDLKNLENLAAVNIALHRLTDAIEIAREIPEECHRRYSIIGYCCQELDLKEDALSNYLKAYKLSPTSREVLMDLAFFYEHENEYDKAFEYVFKVLELDENDIGALAILTELYFYTRQFRKVIECSTKALKISNRRDDIIYPPLAFSYLYLEEPQKGCDCLTQAILAHPDDPFYYMTLGTYLFATNDDEKAMELFKMAHEIDPFNPEPCLSLSMHYKVAGDLKKAKKYYDRYFELEDDCIMGFDEF